MYVFVGVRRDVGWKHDVPKRAGKIGLTGETKRVSWCTSLL